MYNVPLTTATPATLLITAMFVSSSTLLSMALVSSVEYRTVLVVSKTLLPVPWFALYAIQVIHMSTTFAHPTATFLTALNAMYPMSVLPAPATSLSTLPATTV